MDRFIVPIELLHLFELLFAKRSALGTAAAFQETICASIIACSMGPPGAMRVTPKTIIVITNSVGMSRKRLMK